ncbi:MAG: hypothetical protein JXR83_15835 [Deltaproteobacteria bacterium]|nr:hypothetical protein [Deltaproteobacteria bacterium]
MTTADGEIATRRRLLLQELQQTIETMDAHGWNDKPVKKGARHDYYRAYRAVEGASDLKGLLIACVALGSRNGRAWDYTFGSEDGAAEIDQLLACRVEPCAQELAAEIRKQGVVLPGGTFDFSNLPAASVDGRP